MNISEASRWKAFKLHGIRAAGNVMSISFPKFVGILIVACMGLSVLLNGSSSRHLRVDAPPRRVFVCITGQLSRLELGNKMENFFEPVTKAGIHIDVALVISNTSTQSKPGQEKIRNFYSSMEEVVQELSRFAEVTILKHDFHVQHEPVVNENYKRQRGIVIHDPVELDRAVKNHIKQFEGMAQCHALMTDTGRSYEMVHRVREDHGYSLPVDYEKMYRLTQQNERTILVSRCADHSGFNDRGGFASPKAAYSYFNSPVIYMYTKPIRDWVTNTEKFLKDVYTYYDDNHVIELDDFYFYRKKLMNEASNLIEDPEDIQCIKELFGKSHPNRFEFFEQEQ